MEISATIKSSFGSHEIAVHTNESVKEMHISPKPDGFGSSINGGELLLLSLATCFCNDIYREAQKRNLTLSGVEVVVKGGFGGEGEPGSDFTYTVNVTADAPKAAIDELIRYTDNIAEIHNTLRQGLAITLVR
ncbi:OsmC family protein [Spirosoma spitsbergense]|uniref:OsmC family protein n=1 Tax=Spirosoma spitsbergense TaxID=431554 RepID=UPI0003603559|nr:OsmC family protein [Spirosoma spitsbergense]